MATAKSSPLRWQMSPSAGKKDGMNSAACGRLRHLQAVATWASAQVPPLGAFLGSYLASTSQALGTPPPSSPHFTCQRCESVLQVGINCSVRVRSRKRKKWSSVSKEVSPSVNCIFYCCQYCAFENMKLGTSKAYVKTKLSEMAARHKLSELNKGFEEKLTKGLGEKMKKTSNQELESATNVLSIEIAGTSGKKAKRKGWLSLKQLAASSAGSPSTGNRPVLMRSAISDLTPPRMNNLDSFKLLPKFSQVDFKDATSVSSIEEKCSSGVSSLEFNLKLEQSDISAGDIGIENALDVVNLLQDQKVTTMESSLFTTNMSCLNASPHQQQRGLLDFSGELALNSGHYVECVHSIYDIPAVSGQPSNVTNSPQKLGQSVVAMEVEKKEQLSSNRSEACAIVRDQLTAVPFYPKHDKLTFASQGNSVDEGSQIFLDTLSPSSSTEGAMAGKYMPSTLYSFAAPKSLTLSNMFQDRFASTTLHLPSNKEQGVLMSGIHVPLNSGNVESAGLSFRLQDDVNKVQNTSSSKGQSLSQKKEHDDFDMPQKVAKKQKRMAPSGHVYTRKGKVSSSFVGTREVQSKMKPLFWRVGRHWFTKCRLRTTKWRLI